MNDVHSVLNNLPPASFFTLVLTFILIVLQEAVNGFHDTSNAVATVIYSNAMTARHAVFLSAVMNFIGVLIGGTAVAFGMVFLLPSEMVAGINTMHEASLMLALVLTAILWNIGTWWLGIPNSTTHTYIGSIIGVSMAHAYIVGTPIMAQINWGQGQKIFLTLLISPLVGAVLAWLFFKLIRMFIRDPALYEPHQGESSPPVLVRIPLIVASAGVSLLHGTNDGQKSIGLMMMVLMGLAPGLYAIDPVKDPASYQHTIAIIEDLESVAAPLIDKPQTPGAKELFIKLEHIKDVANRDYVQSPLSEAERIKFRAEILDVHTALSKTLHNVELLKLIPPEGIVKLQEARKATSRLVEDVPFWLIVVSAFALGIGTMMGYEKIVKTLGEKMGDKHMSPAQGLSSQAAAVASIGLADFGGMPVSTTHVLTAGVAGSVVSSGDKVQWPTLRRILITWFTTLPGTVAVSFIMALVFYR